MSHNTEETNISSEQADIHAEITALREKVESLMNDCVTPAVVSAAQCAEEAAHRVTDSIANRTERLSIAIRDRPLTSIAIAAFAGYVFGVLHRR
ncbi:hypothetical protein [Roseococcus sp.]|uniref:hypothetical protein n=1 Tax=Roseococcus sp. TaxID=2109646 RepID=UPI003BA8D4C4